MTEWMHDLNHMLTYLMYTVFHQCRTHEPTIEPTVEPSEMSPVANHTEPVTGEDGPKPGTFLNELGLYCFQYYIILTLCVVASRRH